MICTLTADRDSCQRDSGGPELIKGSNAEEDVQVGVISWGLGCATNIFPGVSARISTAYDWIRIEVCERSTAPPSDFECEHSDKDRVETNDTDLNTTSTVLPSNSPSPSSSVSDVDSNTAKDVDSVSSGAASLSRHTLMVLVAWLWW